MGWTASLGANPIFFFCKFFNFEHSLTQIPNVIWEDVEGIDIVKVQVKETVK